MEDETNFNYSKFRQTIENKLNKAIEQRKQYKNSSNDYQHIIVLLDEEIATLKWVLEQMKPKPFTSIMNVVKKRRLKNFI